MPMPFHMKLTADGSAIEGSCTQQGREGTILCQALEHEVKIPRDPQSGLPTGKRVHGPLTVTKTVDKSSPLIGEALTSGKQCEVELEFYRINPTGIEELYYTIKLEQAIVVSQRYWIPNCLDPSKESFTHMEDTAFTYTRIIWTHVVDGVETEDSWLVPRT